MKNGKSVDTVYKFAKVIMMIAVSVLMFVYAKWLENQLTSERMQSMWPEGEHLVFKYGMIFFAIAFVIVFIRMLVLDVERQVLREKVEELNVYSDEYYDDEDEPLFDKWIQKVKDFFFSLKTKASNIKKPDIKLPKPKIMPAVRRRIPADEEAQKQIKKLDESETPSYVLRPNKERKVTETKPTPKPVITYVSKPKTSSGSASLSAACKKAFETDEDFDSVFK